jgi:UDP-3-O-[3-hydroxymyristoyl] N-acetylglucosamine deacetylase
VLNTGELWVYNALAMAKELISATPLIKGRGLHSGREVQLMVVPGKVGEGITFLRRDLVPPVAVPAHLDAAIPQARRTSLQRGTTTISTVEHLLSALWALGIYDAQIHLWGEEVPALDGGARRFCQLLLGHLHEQEFPSPPPWRVTRGWTHRRGETHCVIEPAAEGCGSLECSIRFSHPAIGDQRARVLLGCFELYLTRIAPARTFGLLQEAVSLQAARLACGATLSNTLVFGQHHVLNPEGLRFADEPVRHKILDAMGDLALLGGPFQGRIRLHRCSHQFLVSTLRLAILDGALKGGRATCPTS